MENIFNDRIRQIIEYAQRLEALEEHELAIKICKMLVKREATYDEVDLIEVFYGKRAYEAIHKVADAVRYIFIVKCAVEAYEIVSTRRAVDSGVLPWSKDGVCNQSIKKCFTWLQKRNRQVEGEDVEYYRLLVKVFKGNEIPTYKVSGKHRGADLVNIISGLVSGKIVVKDDGELA